MSGSNCVWGKDICYRLMGSNTFCSLILEAANKGEQMRGWV